MAKIDKVVEILEKWQEGINRPKRDGGKRDPKDYTLDGIRTTLNGGRPLSPSPSLQELSTQEIEELRRAYQGTTGNYDVDFRGMDENMVRPGMGKTLDGSRISKYDLDRIQLEGRPQPGRNLESFNGVEQPDYNFRGFREDNPNVSQPTDTEILEALSNPALKKVKTSFWE
jgi:hypothetical protein